MSISIYLYIFICIRHIPKKFLIVSLLFKRMTHFLSYNLSNNNPKCAIFWNFSGLRKPWTQFWLVSYFFYSNTCIVLSLSLCHSPVLFFHTSLHINRSTTCYLPFVRCTFFLWLSYFLFFYVFLLHF